LLLLRTVIGVAAVAESVFYFSGSEIGPKSLIAGLVLAVSGVVLLIGFRTQLAGIVFALTKFLVLISWVGRPAGDPIASLWADLYAVSIAVAVVLLGPGSVSLDNRLFGPREIIIPGTTRRA
jgi:uncharacterized membrane protein YphA (DoxX/SURF4 family)